MMHRKLIETETTANANDKMNENKKKEDKNDHSQEMDFFYESEFKNNKIRERSGCFTNLSGKLPTTKWRVRSATERLRARFRISDDLMMKNLITHTGVQCLI